MTCVNLLNRFINLAYALWANQIALPCRLDLDGDGSKRGLSDGLAMVRAMLGLRGATLSANAGLSSAAQTENRTDRTARDFVSTKMLDLDGDGQVTMDRDGVILLRAMLGFRDGTVTAGVSQSGAIRQDWNSIKTYLNTSCAAGM
jgi:hypothetical protein